MPIIVVALNDYVGVHNSLIPNNTWRFEMTDRHSSLTVVLGWKLIDCFITAVLLTLLYTFGWQALAKNRKG